MHLSSVLTFCKLSLSLGNLRFFHVVPLKTKTKIIQFTFYGSPILREKKSSINHSYIKNDYQRVKWNAELP